MNTRGLIAILSVVGLVGCASSDPMVVKAEPSKANEAPATEAWDAAPGVVADAENASETEKAEVAAVAEATTTAKADPEADPNEKICKYEAVTGSRFRQKVCATRAHWDAVAEATRQTRMDMRKSRAAQSGACGGSCGGS